MTNHSEVIKIIRTINSKNGGTNYIKISLSRKTKDNIRVLCLQDFVKGQKERRLNNKISFCKRDLRVPLGNENLMV